MPMRPQKSPHQLDTRLNTMLTRGVSALALTVVALSLLAFTTLFTVTSAAAKDIQQLPHEPNNPKIHQVYFNTTDKHEYIYNGQEWVPHDASIDTYVLKKYKKPKVDKDSPNDNGASNKTGQGGAQ